MHRQESYLFKVKVIKTLQCCEPALGLLKSSRALQDPCLTSNSSTCFMDAAAVYLATLNFGFLPYNMEILIPDGF